ncbi:MAG: ferrous iron transport protein A [Aquisalinus sp.]|nr:ferrous iron transport protein A [Aquisalinus sp.]
MAETLTLKNLKRGETGIVTGFVESDSIREEELREIGFAEGDEVQVLEFGSFGGTPISVRLNRTIIAVRANEANSIEVSRA